MPSKAEDVRGKVVVFFGALPVKEAEFASDDYEWLNAELRGVNTKTLRYISPKPGVDYLVIGEKPAPPAPLPAGVVNREEQVRFAAAKQRAERFDEALAEAERIGREFYGHPDETLTLNDQPADVIFGGVRKVFECQDFWPRGDTDLQPRHGTEVTYSKFEVDIEELNDLIKGNPTTIFYEE